jgi:hypothetical protein
VTIDPTVTRDYISRGWQVVPLAAGKKKATNRMADIVCECGARLRPSRTGEAFTPTCTRPAVARGRPSEVVMPVAEIERAFLDVIGGQCAAPRLHRAGGGCRVRDEPGRRTHGAVG